jgi:putative glycosyltransferase (TIGR04372 family)
MGILSKENSQIIESLRYQIEQIREDRYRKVKKSYWIKEQIRQMHQEGIACFLKKVRVLCQKSFIAVLTLLAIPFVLIVRIIKPFVLVRFGALFSSRIGHFAANTEVYLCECDAGMHGDNFLDIFYHVSPICNYQLKKMWDRTLHVFPWARFLDKANCLLPGAKTHIIPMRRDETRDRDIYNLLERSLPHLSFTQQEEEFGKSELHRIGVADTDSFVCFHARDPEYLNAAFERGYWNYHDYRDSNIQNYIPAAEELVRRGYFSIRMGAVVKEKINVDNPRIIDYATKHRTDFLDIYLGARCKFFICDTAGIYAIPEIFRIPIAWVNFIPLEHIPSWSKKQLFIPKKMFLIRERRFLTFREILDSGLGRFCGPEYYKNIGLEIVENTPEEILDLVIEMDERLKGSWQQNAEDEDLQNEFWKLFKPSNLNSAFFSRIGTKFLRQNQELLV